MATNLFVRNFEKVVFSIQEQLEQQGFYRFYSNSAMIAIGYENHTYTYFGINEKGQVLQIEMAQRTNEPMMFQLHTYMEQLDMSMVSEKEMKLNLLKLIDEDKYGMFCEDEQKYLCVWDVFNAEKHTYFDYKIWFYLYILKHQSEIIHPDDFALFPYNSMENSDEELNKSFDANLLKFINGLNDVIIFTPFVKTETYKEDAITKLMKLHKSYVGEWNCGQHEICYCLHYSYHKKEVIIYKNKGIGALLSFPTIPMAEEFLVKNKNLIDSVKYHI